MKLVLLATLVGLSLAAPAKARDVKLIKQPNSFPLVINQPGSYRLKSNFTVPDANTTAISVQADNVTIDLNGFSILGPVVCTGYPVTSCSPSGTGRGIDTVDPVTSTYHSGTTVRNGFVRGMGDYGLLLGDDSAVDNVTAVSNGGPGINAERVTNSAGNRNGGYVGVFGEVVTASIANQNKGGGFSSHTCNSCYATSNGGDGIEGYVAVNSIANYNGATGSCLPYTTCIGLRLYEMMGCYATGNTTFNENADGIAGHNICGTSPCP